VELTWVGRAPDNPIMQNTLLEEIVYKYDETPFGVWRSFGYSTGEVFQEYRSNLDLFGLPLVHYTRGRCPETGRRIVAKGVFAFGRIACGVFAFGHAALGVVAFGQLALGLLLGLGQASTGLVAVGQIAVGFFFGLGQFATGYVSIGQMALGNYVLAQFGVGHHVWDTRGSTPAARQFFRWLIPN
jgi:hypothetical protein